MEENNHDSTNEVMPAPATGNDASLGPRIAAAVIDSLVAVGLGWAAGIVVDALVFPVYIGYMLARDSLPFLQGQSVGKKALNLQAVTETGNSLAGDWNSGLIRNVPLVIPIFPLVELIVLVINKDKPGGLRRFGDQWAKTKVVARAS